MIKHVVLFSVIALTANLSNAQQMNVFDAARNNQLETLQQYILQKGNIDTVNNNGYSLLILAAYNDNLKVVDYLIQHNANLSIQDANGNTALMAACFKGYMEISKTLLVNGASPNQLNYNQANALFFAATFGHVEIVKLLLDYKTDKKIRDKSGKTARDYALIQENEQIAELLK
jgi:uncharacterized protein